VEWIFAPARLADRATFTLNGAPAVSDRKM
jgi:hypothetical protein